MAKGKKTQFVEEFTEFYDTFLTGLADSIDILRSVQQQHRAEYDAIIKFRQDPNALEDIINKLPDDQQAVLLKLLLKAGSFTNRMAMLFETTPQEKKVLADDLRGFITELKKKTKK